jgi:hypothetical protein
MERTTHIELECNSVPFAVSGFEVGNRGAQERRRLRRDRLCLLVFAKFDLARCVRTIPSSSLHGKVASVLTTCT